MTGGGGGGGGGAGWCGRGWEGGGVEGDGDELLPPLPPPLLGLPLSPPGFAGG